MANNKIKFITYDVLEEYGLLDPYYLDNYLDSLTKDDIINIQKKLFEWYYENHKLLVRASESGNSLFNIAPKTLYRFPIADKLIFTLSTIFPFIPFANKIFMHDPIVDLLLFNWTGDYNTHLDEFKKTIKAINKELLLLRQFVDENIIIFYNIINTLSDKDGLHKLFSPELKIVTQEDYINKLLKIYEEDPTLLPRVGERGVIPIEGRKIILRYHFSNAVRGVLAKDAFNSQYSSDSRTDLVVAKKILELLNEKESTQAEKLISMIPKLDFCNTLAL